MMTITAAQIAKLVSGEVAGEPSMEVSDGQAIESAGPSDFTFVAGARNLSRLADCEAGVVIASRELDAELPLDRFTFVLVNDPEAAFIAALVTVRPQRVRPSVGMHPEAHVHPSARIGERTNIHAGAIIAENVVIGEDCEIYPGVYIGPDCDIGDKVTLHPYVVLYHDVTVGSRSTIHAASVIGADGFGYRQIDGRHEKIPHLGSVIVGEDVEIGAATTIDRSAIGATRIGEGTKIDNQVMIAHNCEVGRHNLIVSQVGFAGSVTSGDYVVCAGQVGIADHVHLGSQSIYAAKSGVHKSMPGNQTYMGLPASPAEEATRQIMAVKKLPELRRTVRQLEKSLQALTARLEQLESRPGSQTSKAA